MPITRYAKFGEETTFGTEATTYAETVDPEEASIESAGDDKLIYEGISGLDRIAKLGVYSTSGSLTMPLDDLATGWFWKWLLGGYSVTGTSPSYTHLFTPARGALMKSFSVAIGKDIMEHKFLGNVIDSVDLEVENEWAKLTVNTLGAKDAKGALPGVDPVFTEGNVFTAPMCSLDKDGVDVSAKVRSLKMTIETGADIESSQGFGSRFARKAFMGSMVCTIELTLGFDSDSELLAFWGGSDGPSTTAIDEFKYELHVGENLDFTFPRMVYTAASQPASGRDPIEQTVTARALYDPATQTGPVQISLTNNKASYTVGA